MQKKILILMLPLVLLACKKDPPPPVKYKLGAVERTSKEYLIPIELRKLIENQYLDFLKKKTIVTLTDEKLIDTIPRDFLDVEIFFRSGEPGVLNDHVKFAMPRGGGEIDLREHVKSKKGAFYMTFSAKRSAEPDATVGDIHIYFMSEAKSRKLGGEKFGAGCKAYMDITSYMNKVNAEGGLELNAIDQGYISVVGGVFYFVEFSESRKLYISAVRILDSRYPEHMCLDETQKESQI